MFVTSFPIEGGILSVYRGKMPLLQDMTIFSNTEHQKFNSLNKEKLLDYK